VRKEAERKRNEPIAALGRAVAATAPTCSAAPPASASPCDSDLLQSVANRLLIAVGDGVLDRGSASKAALELTSSRVLQEPGSLARLVVRARAIENLLDDGDYQGLAEWLGV
jgi:hypothetical protein